MSVIIHSTHVCTSHSTKSRVTCIPRVQVRILRFFSLKCIGLMFFLKNIESYFLVFGMFILFLTRSWTHIFTSTRHLVHDTLLRFALSAAPAFLFCACFLFLLLSSLLPLWLFLRHSGLSPPIVRYLGKKMTFLGWKIANTLPIRKFFLAHWFLISWRTESWDRKFIMKYLVKLFTKISILYTIFVSRRAFMSLQSKRRIHWSLEWRSAFRHNFRWRSLDSMKKTDKRASQRRLR